MRWRKCQISLCPMAGRGSRHRVYENIHYHLVTYSRSSFKLLIFPSNPSSIYSRMSQSAYSTFFLSISQSKRNHIFCNVASKHVPIDHSNPVWTRVSLLRRFSMLLELSERGHKATAAAAVRVALYWSPSFFPQRS